MLIAIISINACTFYRKAPKHKPFITENIIKITGDKFSKQEKTNLKARLRNQLDDSSAVISKTSLFFINTIIHPPVFDTTYASLSAGNMRASLYHLGYYGAVVTYKADTSNKKVRVTYDAQPGTPTRIDTFIYRLQRNDLQNLALKSQFEKLIKKNDPVTKGAVLGEINRLVDTLRNNGYYKFTSAELLMRGDTTPKALIIVSNNPFEQLQLLKQAQALRDSPTIRLSLELNPTLDTNRLNRYFINKVIVIPDYYPGDAWDGKNVKEDTLAGFFMRYRQNLFRNSLLDRNLTIKNGDLYRQREFVRTINNFSRISVWNSVNARLIEVPGDSNKVNMILELMPTRKLSAEASIEASYSSTSNTTNALGGNLFGISANFALTNKNVSKEAIRWTHNFRTGIELNNRNRNKGVPLVNSQEISYNGTIVFPSLKPFSFNKLLFPKANSKETFLNYNFSFNDRLGLFNMQSVNLGFGWNFSLKHNWNISWKPLYFEFSYLYNQTDSFNNILKENPFLRTSYTTAFIPGMMLSATHTKQYLNHPSSSNRELNFKSNLEEFFPWGLMNILSKYRRQFIKLETDVRYTITYKKSSLAFRNFMGIGVPIGARDTSLPFFKQFFAGGSNSMRAWPLRGIGPGSAKQEPYGENNFNSRTGDIQFEMNAEYRYDIARIIPDALTLKGALFIDIGNIWNMPNARSKTLGNEGLFSFHHFYRDLGVSAGTGLRLDINNFLLRFDLGFRFKRPEMSDTNNGWKLPSLSFNNFIPKLFGRAEEYKKWRYENFNFTIGINYPF